MTGGPRRLPGSGGGDPTQAGAAGVPLPDTPSQNAPPSEASLDPRLRVLVVGSGLIGTSIGLALQGSADVLLTDRSEVELSEAVARGAGRRWDGVEQVDHAVLAVPPESVAGVLAAMQRAEIALTWSHVASTQSAVQQDIETSSVEASTVCGGHPMSGREQSGAAAATGDLFAGRPWVLCPGSRTTAAALDATRAVVELCGGLPVVLTPEDHDQAVALVSHLPQVAASALAAVVLAGAQDDPAAVELAGPGLQDTTRIAASDPDLWIQVLSRNAVAVAPLVRSLADELARAADALERLGAGVRAGTGMRTGAPGDDEGVAPVADLLRRGRAGRALVPVKQGERDRSFAVVPVGVPDRPGQLAGVLVSAAEAGINVEDVRVEHLAGRPRGVIELLVQVSDRDRARRALAAAGWVVLA